jgi:hypothetical protein
MDLLRTKLTDLLRYIAALLRCFDRAINLLLCDSPLNGPAGGPDKPPFACVPESSNEWVPRQGCLSGILSSKEMLAQPGEIQRLLLRFLGLF